jgi:hypothetical protein
MLAGSAARFLATAQALTDDDLYQASALPGWTRAHVLTTWRKLLTHAPGCCEPPGQAGSASSTPPSKPVLTPSTPVHVARRRLSALTCTAPSRTA